MKRRDLVKLGLLTGVSVAGCTSNPGPISTFQAMEPAAEPEAVDPPETVEARPVQLPDTTETINYPPALKRGDTICCVSPATAIFERSLVDMAKESLEAGGLKVKLGKHILDQNGYLAGTDQNRAKDINEAFADPEVKAIFALRGGWGSNRTLPYLDFDLIKKNPKIFMGFSDITTLLNAFYHKADLVTFHGPVGFTHWNPYRFDYINRLIFQGQNVKFVNEDRSGPLVVTGDNQIRTINAGVAEGRLVGGNMSVWLSLSGTDYLPDVDGKILFFEDVNESVYRIDRYLSTLKLNGTLDRISGLIFGYFRKPKGSKDSEIMVGSFTLANIVEQYVKPLGIPCYMGAQIGHIRHNQTWPVGGLVRMDANEGTLKLLEPAVMI